MSRIRGVVIDVDGTLVNSNDAHARAWLEALAERNIQVAFEDVRPLIGMGGDKLLPRVAHLEEDSELGQKIGARRAEIFRAQYLPRLRPFPKVRELLLKMRSVGLRLAVASSAKKEELQALLQLAKVDDLLEGATSSSDAQSSKPDPDIVRAALNALELEANDAIMLGDTPYDIEAAGQLGLRTVALRCGGRSDADLAGAVAIYDSPADLLERFETSPFGAARRVDAAATSR